METLSTPGVNTLIIQFTTDDKPDQFVPQVIVSEDDNKLWHYMNKMFNTKLTEFHDDGNLCLYMSFIDNTNACIDYRSTDDDKEHSIHWTICRSTLL